MMDVTAPDILLESKLQSDVALMKTTEQGISDAEHQR